MLDKHRGLAITEEQRFRWVALSSRPQTTRACPPTPSFGPPFWPTSSGLALENSQLGATQPPRAPVPHWGWGEAPPYMDG